MAISTLSKFTVPLANDQSSASQGLLMPKLQYRFRVVLENFGISTPRSELTKQVIDITRPNLTFDQVTLDVYNSRVYVAGKHTWDPITITLRDDVNNSVTKLVGEQIQKQFENRSIELAHSVGLQDHMNKNPAILSGGELQRMAFARALMMQPKVVFADEPTASLDIENSENLLSMLQVQVQLGTTVIMVSHDQQALSWADKLLMLKEKGKQIVQV